jgi:class 3 adenylate cyclase
VRCARCDKTNRDDARFCRGCGAPLPSTCDGCGAELPDDAAFCDRCGRAVAPPVAGAPARIGRTAPERERRLVTVLFADVVGSTALAERLDPEDMRDVLERATGVMLTEVERAGGSVNQFTGDGVMALFGAPLALEDAPRRAVEAGLGMQRALGALGDELRAARGIDLRVRIGAHTGLVVVGEMGNERRTEYTAVGDTTNLAARLQTLAAPGTVVVSEVTQRLVAAFFVLRDLGPQAVKGKAEPVRAFEVVGERGVRDRIDALAAAGLTPLAGRARELATLRKAFEAARGGHGQVFFVVGEAGLGKSRLLWEFRQSLAGEPHDWVEGRCAAFGGATAFLPIADALRRWLGIDDRDGEAGAIAKIDAALAAIGDGVTWTRPYVRLLLSLPAGDPAVESLDAAGRRGESFRALKAIMLEMAARQPLVVVCEDLHWADPASVECLGFLADAVPAARILLVLTHRPGFRHPFGDRSYHHRIALDALTAADMAAMTRAILGAETLPPALADLIARKAEGNPLFVEEVAKALFEQGVVRRQGDALVLAGDIPDTAIPDSIHGVLMARLDHLGDEPRRALQTASVIGREFALRLLARVSEVGEGVSALVGELRALELVYEKVAHPELAYMFKHALTHDVAYESMLVQHRRRLHRVIGLTIEELYADRLAEHYETLALHFERGEDWERAFRYHRLAAEKARDGYANQAVIEHATAALAIAQRLGDAVPAAARQELAKLVATSCFFTSEFRASAAAFERAAALAPDTAERATELARAGYSHVWGHAYADAERTLGEALELARRHGHPGPEALARVSALFQTTTRGETDDFDAEADRIEALARRAGNEEALTHVLLYEAEIAEWRGDYPRVLPVCERVLDTARRLQIPIFVIFPQWFIAKAATCLGQYERALQALRSALDVCERLGDRAFRSRLENTLGWCLAEIGAAAQARAANARAAVLAHELGDPEIRANAEINLALNDLELADADAAAARLEPIAAEYAQPGDPWMRWRLELHVHDAAGRIALARRDPAAALAHADAELAGARRHRARKLEGRALELRGRALLAQDAREEAGLALGEALAVAAAIGYPPTQWRALRLMGEIARRAGRPADVEVHAARRRTLVEPLATALPDDLRRTLFTSAGVGETGPGEDG